MKRNTQRWLEIRYTLFKSPLNAHSLRKMFFFKMHIILQTAQNIINQRFTDSIKYSLHLVQKITSTYSKQRTGCTRGLHYKLWEFLFDPYMFIHGNRDCTINVTHRYVQAETTWFVRLYTRVNLSTSTVQMQKTHTSYINFKASIWRLDGSQLCSLTFAHKSVRHYSKMA
jgi:hypothetical protein